MKNGDSVGKGDEEGVPVGACGVPVGASWVPDTLPEEDTEREVVVLGEEEALLEEVGNCDVEGQGVGDGSEEWECVRVAPELPVPPSITTVEEGCTEKELRMVGTGVEDGLDAAVALPTRVAEGKALGV